jgi:hypothetical protein
MVRRCNLAKVEEDMAWLACAWDLCEIWCLCEFGSSSRGRPWWLYICSQLGFTSNVCLLLQVKVLGLAGFGYPSSGLLPWQEPGRQISRTEGSYPRQPPSPPNSPERRHRHRRYVASAHPIEPGRPPIILCRLVFFPAR